MLHRRQFGFADEPFGQCLGFDLIDWNSASIIIDPNDDAVAFLTGGDGQLSFTGFSLGLPLCGYFNPMIDGIAHQVDQRISDFVRDGLVKFGFN